MTKKIVLWIVAIILILGLLGIGVYLLSKSSAQKIVEDTNIIQGNNEKLDFCSSEEDCMSYLKNLGMDSNYLENNNLKISCLLESCYAEEK